MENIFSNINKFSEYIFMILHNAIKGEKGDLHIHIPSGCIEGTLAIVFSHLHHYIGGVCSRKVCTASIFLLG